MRLLLYKGLDDGAERLRAQLRDTAQQGRRDEYGGDDIEDTAVSGSKRAAAELLKQRKENATEQPSDPARNGASVQNAHRNESPIIRTKDTEDDAADEASADGAEQTASEYITRSRHFGNDRYSAKCGGSFTQKY